MNRERFILSSRANEGKKADGYICCMRVLSLVLLNLFVITVISAQDTAESLTDEFSRLSAKARTRLAKKEAAEAAADTHFQNLMHRADSLFQVSEYYSSLGMYENARTRRPLNVHPKVKIQDLQALIKREEDKEGDMNGELDGIEAELPLNTTDLNAAPQTDLPAEEVPGSEPDQKEEAEEVFIKAKDPSTVKTEGPFSKPQSPSIIQTAGEGTPELQMHDHHDSPSNKVKQFALEPKNIISKTQEPKIGHIPSTSTDTNVRLEDSVEKEIYNEANAVVTQLTVVSNGNVDIYKKVNHQWGSVFYFKNGIAITARMWEDETLTFY